MGERKEQKDKQTSLLTDGDERNKDPRRTSSLSLERKTQLPFLKFPREKE